MTMPDRLADQAAAAVNAGLGVLLAAVLAFEAHDLAASGRNWVFDVVVALVVSAAALLRRRNHAWAAAVGLAVCAGAELGARLWALPGQPLVTATLALLVLIGSAVRALPAGPAVAVTAGGLAIEVSVAVLHPDAGHLPPELLAVAVGTGLWLRFLAARRRAAIETVRRGERLELARELHDAAAHHVTGIVLQAQAARIAARKYPERLDEALAGIESAAADTLGSMRQVIGLLRDTGDAAGLAPAAEPLSSLVDRFARRGPAARLCLPDGPPDPAWPPELSGAVYRVVQEALTNVVRHAPAAREVVVTLAHDQRAITVGITDDAPAPGATRRPHASGYGLVGMRERVEALGGHLQAGPGPVTGWSVLATLPAVGRERGSGREGG
jgi:signal transduction histidine kinase